MKGRNILITSVGKRVSLVKEFQNELKSFFPDAKVFTTDMNPEMAPAAIVSDGCFKVPRVTSDGYIDILIDICKCNDVSIIIPTIDTELLILSAAKEKFKEIGHELLVSDYSFISICRDKRNTNKFFTEKGFRIPKLIDKNNPSFPIFAKPYDGSLSMDLFLISKVEELTPDILNHPKLIFMELIDKSIYKEFTVDMYYGRDNYVKSIVPRERIEIRAGEINKGFTRKNILVNYLKDRLDYLPGVVGCLCIQLFYDEFTDDIVGIEVNPRFGGGYPLSYHAGANYPALIVKEYLMNERIEYSENWRNNTLMLRYDSEIIVYEKDECSSI